MGSNQQTSGVIGERQTSLEERAAFKSAMETSTMSAIAEETGKFIYQDPAGFTLNLLPSVAAVIMILLFFIPAVLALVPLVSFPVQSGYGLLHREVTGAGTIDQSTFS